MERIYLDISASNGPYIAKVYKTPRWLGKGYHFYVEVNCSLGGASNSRLGFSHEWKRGSLEMQSEIMIESLDFTKSGLVVHIIDAQGKKGSSLPTRARRELLVPRKRFPRAKELLNHYPVLEAV